MEISQNCIANWRVKKQEVIVQSLNILEPGSQNLRF